MLRLERTHNIHYNNFPPSLYLNAIKHTQKLEREKQIFLPPSYTLQFIHTLSIEMRTFFLFLSPSTKSSSLARRSYIFVYAGHASVLFSGSSLAAPKRAE